MRLGRLLIATDVERVPDREYSLEWIPGRVDHPHLADAAPGRRPRVDAPLVDGDARGAAEVAAAEFVLERLLSVVAFEEPVDVRAGRAGPASGVVGVELAEVVPESGADGVDLADELERVDRHGSRGGAHQDAFRAR